LAAPEERPATRAADGHGRAALLALDVDLGHLGADAPLARLGPALLVTDDRPGAFAVGVAGAAQELAASAAADDHLLAAEVADRLELGHELPGALVGELARHLAVGIGRAREEPAAPARADLHRRAALGARLVGLLGWLLLALLVDGHGAGALLRRVVARTA